MQTSSNSSSAVRQ